jgi:hypothetical protein
MTQYVVLLPGDEAEWEKTPQEEKERIYGIHEKFSQALEARGHEITGGAELTHSREAKVLRTDADGNHTLTDGPYTETVEQLTGFYLVQTDDFDDLVEVCKILGRDAEGAIEIRATTGSGS